MIKSVDAHTAPTKHVTEAASGADTKKSGHHRRTDVLELAHNVHQMNTSTITLRNASLAKRAVQSAKMTGPAVKNVSIQVTIWATRLVSVPQVL